MAVPAPLLDRTVAKVTRRLLPSLLLMYVLSFLDRANIGFAKRAFQADTGISDAAYALGAGLFFVSYALLEVPSNLVMHKVGARVWMCRIMVTWGLVSAAMMLVRGATAFYLVRLLLGAAEAGFIAVQPLFWTFPTSALAGTAAAGGIALVNALGALGGFVAPNVRAWAEATFASASAGLYLLAAATLVGAVAILGLSAVGLSVQEQETSKVPEGAADAFQREPRYEW